MTNGIDHHQGGGEKPKKASVDSKPEAKPEAGKPAPAKAGGGKQSGK